MKSISSLLLVGSLFISPLFGQEKDPFEKLNQRRDQVIEQLNKAMTCDSHSSQGLYCHTEFRGLKVEFAGVNSQSGGTLYIHSIGNDQSVVPFGNNCLEVQFSGKDLAQGLFPVQVILRNDAKIFNSEQLAKDKKGCS